MQELSIILTKLSQNILKTNQSSRLKLSKLLLSSLDPSYFTEGFMMQISTFSQLNSQISLYYLQKFNQKIRQSLFYETQIDNRFVAMYRLITDLSLNGQNKQNFLNAILEMNEDEKNLLMEFVGEVVKRQQFIDFNKEQEDRNFNSQISSENMVIQEKFIQLKQYNDQLQKKYNQLFQANSNLKNAHQTALAELNHLKQDKLDLLSELGLHKNAGLIQIIQKYRKQVSDFNKQSQRLHKQLQQKCLQIKAKQREQQQMILNFSAKQQSLTNSYHQKTAQLLKKNSLIQSNSQQLKERQQQYRFEIVRLKDIIIDLRKQIETKNASLYQQEITINKFNKMKKLHLEFRKTMIEGCRNTNNIAVGGTRYS